MLDGFEGSLEPDPAYVEGGEFLKSLGMTNQAEISRILDIAMNPDSLFLSPSERRMSNASVLPQPLLFIFSNSFLRQED